MQQLDFVNDVDPIKAWFTLLLAGVVAAWFVYFWQQSVEPQLNGLVLKGGS